ncbi:histidine phosphatase family protein [Jatrophihabitans telluris]|uniref:Histidine phosphatase family protein n=1 Tax=Jatrophihabitans telluris TaxID=2038343 RepID=A0ABY4QZ81_9ACTN|nr:histidine phosphatase family protein [Jatrophihabitans telluris]UQX88880.1 histidine phosphatase family protein [Jatrophihabitans telluris]
MVTTVHLLRHGEVFNPDKVLYGRLPGYRLSQSGQEMAVKAAAHLAGRDVVHVVSSPLQRAQETAGPMAAQFGLDVATDDRLIEAGNAFEGRRVTGEGGVLKKPSSWWLYRNPLRPSWGEPYEQVAKRMLAAALKARDVAEGHEAVCVSHQLPIVCLRRFVEGQHLWHDPRKRRCSLASITSLVFDGEDVVRVDYAEPAGHSENDISRQQAGS